MHCICAYKMFLFPCILQKFVPKKTAASADTKKTAASADTKKTAASADTKKTPAAAKRKADDTEVEGSAKKPRTEKVR